MGSDPRPIAARYGLALALALITAGCANTSVSVSGGGAQPVASAPGSSALGLLMLFGMAASYESWNNGTYYRANPLDALGPPRAPLPPLDPSRRVLEVDCTKPIEDWSANLRCR